MRLRKRILLTAVSAVALFLLVAPFLVPERLFLPRLELAASERLGTRVRIASARLYLLPFPHAALRDLSVGGTRFIEVGRLSVTPRMKPLLTGDFTVRSIELSDVKVTQPAIAWAERSFGRSDNTPNATVDIERILLHRVDLRLGKFSMDGLDADIRLAPGLSVQSIQIFAAGRKARLDLVPESHQRMRITLSGQDWTIPVEPHITFARVAARGTLTSDALELGEINGDVYQGTLDGDVRVGWADGWSLSGRADVKQINVEPLARKYSNETAVSGRLDAASVFKSSSASAAGLIDELRLEAEFELHDGMLHKVDLESAANLLATKQEKKNGVTRFDRFAGHLTVNPQGFQFSNMRITSGALDAKGYVMIAPDKKLSGRIDAALKGTGSLVSTPLVVSGTLDAPRALPTKGTLAGAAAGTLLLGPGIGTTLGIKAGQLAERLFGKKPPKPELDPEVTESAKTPPKSSSSGSSSGR